jgi:MFS family permease
VTGRGPVARLIALAAPYRGFSPDARRFLLVTLTSGAALSLWWIDFNLYLASLGFDTARIGLVAAAASIAGAVASLQASALSDRFGRRWVMLAGGSVSVLAIAGLIATRDPTLILVFAAAFAAGDQAVHVVAVPYMSEHSRPEHRSELFALQFAIGNATNVVAAALGGIVARVIAERVGFVEDGPDTYRIILVFMVGLLVAALLVILRLSDDRPARARTRIVPATAAPDATGQAVSAGSVPQRGKSITRLGLTILDRRMFFRLLLPGFLISIGAGQVIPFMNLFVQDKFGLDLAALNGVFALTSVGTMLAVLYQPTLARRFGRLRSVVLVQGISIPFLVVLGFSPILWTVIAAMAVRNSLMNAGNPIASAFSMDRVSKPERATLAASSSLMWSLGWVIGGFYYSAVHSALGFGAGYALNFATIIVLYSVATVLYWYWFHDAEPLPGAAAGPKPPAAVSASTD